MMLLLFVGITLCSLAATNGQDIPGMYAYIIMVTCHSLNLHCP